MKISPLAGKPAPRSMLVDVPRLVDAFYSQVPDPAIPGQQVAFGTSGHRGSSLLTTFNEWHVARHHPGHLPSPRGARRRRSVVPRHRYARAVDAGLRECARSAGGQWHRRHAGGTRRVHADPAISHAILTHNRGRTEGLADGIVVTPSHNPPEDGGFRYNPRTGAGGDRCHSQDRSGGERTSEERPSGREANALRAGSARAHHTPV